MGAQLFLHALILIAMELTEQLLRTVHSDYLSQKERIVLPARQIGNREQETRFRASRLYGCSVADHYARTGKEHTHPHSYSLLQRFEQGNRVAQVWQEALMWGMGKYPELLSVDYETPLENDTLVGQADLVINGLPVEIKNTIRYQPFDGHILQLMAYCKLLNAPRGFLIYQRDFNNSIFAVENNDAVVDAAILEIAAPAAPPESLYEIRPGFCCTETSADEIFPREARRANAKTGVQKGDVVPGTATVKCQYFGHCFPWSSGHEKFRVYGTNESLAVGEITEIIPDIS